MSDAPSDPVTYELPPMLDTASAGAIRDGLLGLRGRPLLIDGSAVQMLGAHCAELLLAARQTWKEDGAPLSVANPSTQMLTDIDLLGLSPADFATEAV